jgi:hypothetical protein
LNVYAVVIVAGILLMLLAVAGHAAKATRQHDAEHKHKSD